VIDALVHLLSQPIILIPNQKNFPSEAIFIRYIRCFFAVIHTSQTLIPWHFKLLDVLGQARLKEQLVFNVILPDLKKLVDEISFKLAFKLSVYILVLFLAFVPITLCDHLLVQVKFKLGFLCCLLERKWTLPHVLNHV